MAKEKITPAKLLKPLSEKIKLRNTTAPQGVSAAEMKEPLKGTKTTSPTTKGEFWHRRGVAQAENAALHKKGIEAGAKELKIKGSGTTQAPGREAARVLRAEGKPLGGSVNAPGKTAAKAVREGKFTAKFDTNQATRLRAPAAQAEGVAAQKAVTRVKQFADDAASKAKTRIDVSRVKTFSTPKAAPVAVTPKVTVAPKGPGLTSRIAKKGIDFVKNEIIDVPGFKAEKATFKAAKTAREGAKWYQLGAKTGVARSAARLGGKVIGRAAAPVMLADTFNTSYGITKPQVEGFLKAKDAADDLDLVAKRMKRTRGIQMTRTGGFIAKIKGEGMDVTVPDEGAARQLALKAIKANRKKK